MELESRIQLQKINPYISKQNIGIFQCSRKFICTPTIANIKEIFQATLEYEFSTTPSVYVKKTPTTCWRPNSCSTRSLKPGLP